MRSWSVRLGAGIVEQGIQRVRGRHLALLGRGNPVWTAAIAGAPQCHSLGGEGTGGVSLRYLRRWRRNRPC